LLLLRGRAQGTMPAGLVAAMRRSP